MKFKDWNSTVTVSIVNDNNRTQIQKEMVKASISALIIVGFFIAAPSIVVAQQPGSNATSTVNATIDIVAQQNP